jgi:hypothetical protein
MDGDVETSTGARACRRDSGLRALSTGGGWGGELRSASAGWMVARRRGGEGSGGSR